MNKVLDFGIFKISKAVNVFFIISVLVLFGFVINKGVVIEVDSEGYLIMELYRSPTYPLFLSIMNSIFGKNYLFGVIIFHLIFGLFSIFVLLSTLYRYVLNKTAFLIIIYLILLMPYLYEFRLANIIMSESLAYPLYLLCINYILKGVFENEHKNFWKSIILLFFLILVRAQFLYLIIVLGVSFVVLKRKSIFEKKNLLLFISIIFLPIITIGTDVVFHYIKHNQAVTTPWTGIQVATLPFFISQPKDSICFENKTERAYFNYVHQEISKKKLLKSQINPDDEDIIGFYFKNYVTICNATIKDQGELFYKTNDLNQRLILNDKMCLKMAYPLIKANYKDYFSMLSKNISKGFGTTKYFLLFLILLGISFKSLLKEQTNRMWFIFVTILSSMGNVFIVALAQSTTSRYVFYNNWVLICIVLILISKIHLIEKNLQKE